jgi:hypothetical protein
MSKKYTLLQNRLGYTAGVTVYEYMRHDYGCSPDGGAPFFTAPVSILKAQ